eukprot:TRINITY_DN29283_c0_g2_i1.p1 TRINITY_DN29283_c0_g2~~TRINITY_DN29283_c0_g2_i1.p1  ORF type:complete len:164 (+),score=36.69 TRINITY_DN29283_c0_g2_i1:170-661(+)
MSYQEVAVFPNEKLARKAAAQAQTPAPPEVVQRLIDQGRLPGPGQGPSPAQRSKSRFQSLLIAESRAGESVVCTVNGGEGGYEETAKMAVEAALALIYDGAACPGVVGGGGFMTPAACMGTVLIHRLNNAGIKFQVLSDAARSDTSTHAQRAIVQFVQAVSKL